MDKIANQPFLFRPFKIMIPAPALCPFSVAVIPEFIPLIDQSDISRRILEMPERAPALYGSYQPVIFMIICK